MKHRRAIEIASIILLICLFISVPVWGADHSFSVTSGSLDGELRSKGSSYGRFELGDKGFNRGAVGGGTRGFEWVINTSKSPGKKGARGAIDGEPDIGGSSKGNTFTTTSLGDTIRIGQSYTANYELFKAFLSFDTSAIPYDATIKSATLTIYGKAKQIDPGSENFDIQVYKSVWTEPLWNPDWGAVVGSIRGILNTSDFQVAQTNTITINALNANYLIVKGGTTKIALVSSRTMDQIEPNGNEYVEIYASNSDAKEFRPALTVDYDGSAPNVKPSLTWTGETYYKLNGVYPEEVWVGENSLTFKVQYTHPLDVPPQITQLWIDLNFDGDFSDPGEKVDMRETDISDTDYSNGKNYFAQVTINSDGVNDLEYRFMFTDENDTAAIGIPTQVASIASIQSEEKNTCFINTAEDTHYIAYMAYIENLKDALKKRPLLNFIVTSICRRKIELRIEF